MAIKQVRFVKHTSYGAYYNSGEVAGFEHEQAAELVKGGHAELVVSQTPATDGEVEREIAFERGEEPAPTFTTASTLEDVRDVMEGRRPKGKK
jgi:hypothetical protein